MKLPILDSDSKEIGKIELPSQFNEDVRQDIIQKAVEVIQSHKRQPYGASPEAGKRASAKLSRRRRDYKGAYGHGISRVPRKIMSRRGTRFNWEAAFAPGTRGGRRAHPPKADKIWAKKINKKERRKAIRSALSATVNKKIVEERGHIVPEKYPFVLDSKIESLKQTKEVKTLLQKLGLKEELKRVNERKIRAGKGKSRGRKYKKKQGILLVVGNDCNLTKSARNIPGVEIAKAKTLNAEQLAPGANPGRLALFTKDAIEKIKNEKLFM